MEIFFQILIILLGLIGVSICLFVRKKKARKVPFVCPVGFDCEAVIRSKHTKFLGIDLELIGLVYYSFIFLSYLYSIFFVFSDNFAFILIFSSFSALIFSLYLTFLQMFVIRQWCSWCLSSAVVTLFIFIISFCVSNLVLVEFLAPYSSFIMAINMFALAIGVGVSFVLNLLFLKFASDKKISKVELDVLHTLSQFMWFMIFALVITGVLSYILNSGLLVKDDMFIAGALILILLIAKRMIFDLIIYPKFLDESKDEDRKNGSELIKRSLVLTSFSLTSWLFLFFLFLADITFIGWSWTFSEIIAWYIVFVFAIIFFVRFLELVIGKKL